MKIEMQRVPIGSDRCLIRIEFSREHEKRGDPAENAAIVALLNLETITVVGDEFENVTRHTTSIAEPDFVKFRTRKPVYEPSWATVGLTGIYGIPLI